MKRGEYGYNPSDIEMGYEPPVGRGGALLTEFKESEAYQLARAEKVGIMMRQEMSVQLKWDGVDESTRSFLNQMLT